MLISAVYYFFCKLVCNAVASMLVGGEFSFKIRKAVRTEKEHVIFAVKVQPSEVQFELAV